MPDSANIYIIDTSSVAEIVRLIDQEDLLTEVMGGLFPVEIDGSRPACVLDLGCGPGEWALNVASEFSHMTVLGVDIDHSMIDYAKASASVQFLENVTFEVMNVKQPLDFPDGSFDLINGRLLFGFMDRDAWPRLLAECMRVLRPGGSIQLAEFEVSISNSIALQHLHRCLYRALADQERTFSVDQRSIGICHMLSKLLKEAGCREIASRPFLIDSSYDTPHHYSSCKNTETGFVLVKPYLLKTAILEEAEYEACYHQMQIDMRQERFVNVSFGLQIWGHKS